MKQVHHIMYHDFSLEPYSITQASLTKVWSICSHTIEKYQLQYVQNKYYSVCIMKFLSVKCENEEIYPNSNLGEQILTKFDSNQ